MGGMERSILALIACGPERKRKCGFGFLVFGCSVVVYPDGSFTDDLCEGANGGGLVTERVVLFLCNHQYPQKQCKDDV